MCDCQWQTDDSVLKHSLSDLTLITKFDLIALNWILSLLV